MARITVDEQKFIYVDGVKFGKLDWLSRSIEFVDKNPIRSINRGGREVSVSIVELVKFVEDSENGN